jgi:hypothetical protein
MAVRAYRFVCNQRAGFAGTGDRARKTVVARSRRIAGGTFPMAVRASVSNG